MKFTGVIPALITPIDKDEKLNVPVLEKLINDQISQGADGFYVCGATGEGITIDKDVHKAMTRESVRIVDGRVPVIVHAARMNYHEMLELASYAEEAGADAISAIPPLFYKYTDDAIFNYYERLCATVKIPVVIYNNPNTGVSFSLDLLKRLFTIPNLTSIKWTNFDFFSVLRLKDEVPEANVINGPDEMLALGLLAGCDACIGTTYNYQLPLIKKIFIAMQENRVEDARRLQMQADASIAKILTGGTGALMATKFILSKMGYDVYYPVFPMPLLTKEQEQSAIEAARICGIDL